MTTTRQPSRVKVSKPTDGFEVLFSWLCVLTVGFFITSGGLRVTFLVIGIISIALGLIIHWADMSAPAKPTKPSAEKLTRPF
jgi:sugar phosphate permease